MLITQPSSLAVLVSALALCACQSERKPVGFSENTDATGSGAGGGDLLAPPCDETAASDDVSGAWVAEFGIFLETMELEQTGACLSGTMCNPDDEECYAVLGVIVDGKATFVGRAAEGDLDAQLTLSDDGAELFGSVFQTKCKCSGDHKFIRP